MITMTAILVFLVNPRPSKLKFIGGGSSGDLGDSLVGFFSASLELEVEKFDTAILVDGCGICELIIDLFGDIIRPRVTAPALLRTVIKRRGTSILAI